MPQLYIDLIKAVLTGRMMGKCNIAQNQSFCCMFWCVWFSGLGLFSDVLELFTKIEAQGLENEGKKQVLMEYKEELAVSYC